MDECSVMSFSALGSRGDTTVVPAGAALNMRVRSAVDTGPIIMSLFVRLSMSNPESAFMMSQTFRLQSMPSFAISYTARSAPQ